ncbi:hypothetical protein Ancab_036455 [Ancistrocladus abbreviatus]
MTVLSGNPSEKESITNANSLRGFEVIDEVKAEIEAYAQRLSHALISLYSFNATNPQDPSLDPAFAAILKTKCPSLTNNPNVTVPLDFTTPYGLDNKYYQNLQYSRGLLTSDESLMTSASTVAIVSNFARQGEVWANKFAGAMVRMGLIDVLTGSDGEIRKNCRLIN